MTKIILDTKSFVLATFKTNIFLASSQHLESLVHFLPFLFSFQHPLFSYLNPNKGQALTAAPTSTLDKACFLRAVCGKNQCRQWRVSKGLV